MNAAMKTTAKGLFALAASLVLAGAVFAQTTQKKEPLTEEVKTDVLKGMEKIISTAAYVPGVDFSKWSEFVTKHEADIKKAATETEFVNAVNGALEDFGFSHIYLFPPSFGEQRATGKRAGIGIRVQIEEGGLRITDIFPDSPASKAGLQRGDLVFENDGKPVKSTADLAGDKGQTSTIKYKRGTEEKSITVTRDEYKTVIPESIEWKGESAIITIPTFDQGYSTENVEKIMGEAMKAKLIVLDLRSNGGGRVTNLMHLMGYFLKRETEPLGTFIGRAAMNAYKKENPDGALDLVKIADFTKGKVRPFENEVQFAGKVAVLISGSTGSASEMAAAALKEYKGATLIGSPSAGAVLASMFAPLESGHGYILQFPMTDYVTIKGRRLEANPLKPDVTAEIPGYGQEDKALTAALGLLKSGSK